MSLRLLAATGLLVLLAACDNSPKPPPAQTASTTAPTAAAATAPAAAGDATAPLIGTWSADLGTCGTDAVTITAAAFQGGGNQCTISGLADDGNGGFTATMACTGNGAKASERLSMRPVFAPSGEGIELVWLDRANQTSTVLRCPTAKTASAQ